MTTWHDTSKGLVPQVPHPPFAHPMATLPIPTSTLTHAETEVHAAVRQDAQVQAEGRKRPNLEKQATEEQARTLDEELWMASLGAKLCLLGVELTLSLLCVEACLL